MALEGIRTAVLLSLITAFAWVTAGAAFDGPPEAIPTFDNISLCIHRPAR